MFAINYPLSTVVTSQFITHQKTRVKLPQLEHTYILVNVDMVLWIGVVIDN